ncbi:MAG TPA: ABC transporter ATP-binding protein, partial [Xanthomonadales bacterium]|nr:ABC transporter ATP-binding protein [Xanthomonadales bacterium]
MTRLHVENLHASLGNKPILHDINVSLDSGQLLGIIGMNGAGKTTLLHIMAGLLPPSNGNVWLDGEALERINHLSRRIAYLEQSAHCHWPLEV